jgi:hypothetical protein
VPIEGGMRINLAAIRTRVDHAVVVGFAPGELIGPRSRSRALEVKIAEFGVVLRPTSERP